ncbi:hypothetical protein P152DRAFT_457176 [Eremomyces bilateralis CBS 781.70]|uniref:Uncharacterized protein n=1 Tax=Eremomyces bilateralis CBS 781.70 TaxID=1392243 RepID=A0A6G1G6W0_9PEZI|nr:uncharacterized protein P152DRAFT_457176 [Eremomyces bilateralis CBS 781.70]KAF1813807.1 hypothetical protein P152DRAFT_457176 [Eremomyces bilateralis CBS 781.70]
MWRVWNFSVLGSGRLTGPFWMTTRSAALLFLLQTLSYSVRSRQVWQVDKSGIPAGRTWNALKPEMFKSQARMLERRERKVTEPLFLPALRVEMSPSQGSVTLVHPD